MAVPGIASIPLDTWDHSIDMTVIVFIILEILSVDVLLGSTHVTISFSRLLNVHLLVKLIFI